MPQPDYQLGLITRGNVTDYGQRHSWYSRKTNEEITSDWDLTRVNALRAQVLFYDQQSGFMRFLRRFFSGAGIERLRAQLVYWESKQFLSAYLATKEPRESIQVLSGYGNPVIVSVPPLKEPKNWVLEEQIKRLSFWSMLRNQIREFFKEIQEMYQAKNTGEAILPRAKPTVLAAAEEARSLADEHYRVLGVLPSSNLTAITRAYRGLSLQYHPDKGGPAEEFRRLVEAYNFVLKYAKPEPTPAANEVMSSDEFERDLIARGFSPEEARQRRAYHDETMGMLKEFHAKMDLVDAKTADLTKRINALAENGTALQGVSGNFDLMKGLVPQPKYLALDGRDATENAETVVEDVSEASSLAASSL